MAFTKVYVQRFLKNFKKPVQICYAVGTHAASGMIPSTLDYALVQNSCDHNGHEKDCYFYVNSGGTKQDEIKFLNACFVDIDAGRDANKKYFKKSIVDAKKRKMMAFIKEFTPQPNLVVETRNGYQLYWMLPGVPANPENVRLWKQIQIKINNAFREVGSDPKVMKINQIMRLPGTIWYKKYEGKKETFQTTFTKMNKLAYFTLPALESYFRNESGFLKFDKRPLKKYDYSAQKRAEKSNIVKYSKDGKKVLRDINDPNLKDFLRDIAQILYAKKMNFLSKQAWSFYNSL